jgi:hypothetical protein
MTATVMEGALAKDGVTETATVTALMIVVMATVMERVTETRRQL